MRFPKHVLALSLTAVLSVSRTGAEPPTGTPGSAMAAAVVESAAAAPAPDERDSKVDAIFERWNSPDTPGCVCAVIEAGRVTYAKGYGMADLEHNAHLTPDSVFYIASTSKQFTAASIALLSLDGRLSLSDDIHKYFPEFHDYGESVTVDELVHHTSGIRDYLELLDLTGWRGSDYLDNARVLRLLARQRALNFKPGSRFLYSNSNYVLLAEIVKRVSGKSLPEFAAEHLFQPLGMTETRIESDAHEIVPNRVESYAPKKGSGYSHFLKTIESYGDGNVLTTVGDLARWDANFYTGKVGGAPFLKLILTPGVLADGKPTDYAFGLVHGIYHGLSIVSHEGTYMGFRTELLRFPDQGLSVAVLCNLASMNPGALARRVADIYLVAKFTAENRDHPSAPPPRTAVKIDPALLDAYLGRFALDDTPQVTLTFTKEGDKLFAQASRQPRQQIFPSSEIDFFYRAVDAQITFHREADGSVNRVTLHQDGDLDWHRIKEYSLAATSLAQYAGKYYSDELDVTYEVVMEDGQLTVRDPQADRLPMLPRAPDIFDAGSGKIAFRRDPQGQIDGLSFSSGRTLNLQFVRKMSASVGAP